MATLPAGFAAEIGDERRLDMLAVAARPNAVRVRIHAVGAHEKRGRLDGARPVRGEP
jgi:hypothetical protein